MRPGWTSTTQWQWCCGLVVDGLPTKPVLGAPERRLGVTTGVGMQGEASQGAIHDGVAHRRVTTGEPAQVSGGGPGPFSAAEPRPQLAAVGGAEVAPDLVIDLRGDIPGSNGEVVALPSSGLLAASWWQLLIKRGMDFAGAAIALLMLAPILIVVALTVVLSSPGPVFFKQTRVGRDRREFTLWKFRSMYVGSDELRDELLAHNEQSGPVFKLRNDPRVTRVGRVIRKYSIDELPQLFQVLTGKMSLVGPRPPLPDEVVEYGHRELRRLTVKPGLTCIWQTSGRSDVRFDQWVDMDLEYIDNFSLWLDIVLLFKTIPAVLAGRGAY